MADRRLQIFHAVATELSFTKAADMLFMTQPAVTAQIKQLEEHYNTRLFARGRGGISLTPAGALMLECARRIIGLSSEMDRRVGKLTDEIGGFLPVGASTTIGDFLLPRILGQFKLQYPKVKPSLTVANSGIIEMQVVEHTIDVGLIESPSHHAKLQTDVCCDDELQVICSPKFPLARHRELSPAQLLEHPYISRETGSGTREYTEDYLRQAGLNPASMQLVMELGGPEALNGVVETGLGFAIASRATVRKAQRTGDLVAIPLKPRLIRSLSIVYPRDNVKTRLVTAFLDFATLGLRHFSAG